MKAYVAVGSTKKDQNELTSTVKHEPLSPLAAFGKGLGQLVAAAGRAITRIEPDIRNVTGMTVKEWGKLKTELASMNQELSGTARDYSSGILAG